MFCSCAHTKLTSWTTAANMSTPSDKRHLLPSPCGRRVTKQSLVLFVGVVELVVHGWDSEGEAGSPKKNGLALSGAGRLVPHGQQWNFLSGYHPLLMFLENISDHVLALLYLLWLTFCFRAAETLSVTVRQRRSAKPSSVATRQHLRNTTYTSHKRRTLERSMTMP